MSPTRIWIEDGEILCCSSMCDAGGECFSSHKCKPVPKELQQYLDMLTTAPQPQDTIN